MHLLSLGKPRRRARASSGSSRKQHPGETMAGWFMEGLASRLAFDDDEVVSRLLETSRIFLVLCMNPDGAFAGNHRTNEAGKDLNRCWWEADDKDSPEVLAIRKAIVRARRRLLSRRPWRRARAVRLRRRRRGQPALHRSHRGASRTRIRTRCSKRRATSKPKRATRRTPRGKRRSSLRGQLRRRSVRLPLAHARDCPSRTTRNAPDERVGWSPDRCRTLGATTLKALAEMVDDLR